MGLVAVYGKRGFQVATILNPPDIVLLAPLFPLDPLYTACTPPPSLCPQPQSNPTNQPLPNQIPQYAPSASYRHLEFLLGRIPSLTTESSFTTDPFQQPGDNQPLGNGTAPPVKAKLKREEDYVMV